MHGRTGAILPWLGVFEKIIQRPLPMLVLQDSAMKRPANETILAEGDMVTGVNTKFTELFQDRDKLRFRGKSEQFKV